MNQILEIFKSLHMHVFDADRLPAAIAAILLVSLIGVLTGPLGGNANPVFWRAVDILFGPVGGKLDKSGRSRSDLMARGTIITFFAVVLAFGVGLTFQILTTHFRTFLLPDIVALSLIISSGPVWHVLVRVHKAVDGKEKVKGAFYALATTTRANLAIADEYTITRTGIALAARLFDKALVAPVFWYLIAGLPGAYLYAALAALSWRFGKDGFSAGFGATPVALEKLMGFVPNIFSGMIVACAGLLTPTAGMTRSFLGILKFGKVASPYEQGGVPVTAMAYALKISLGGPVQDMDGSALQRGWTGPKDATARLEAKHLHRAVYISVMAHLLFLFSLLILIYCQNLSVM
jgi:adenosylcobinamide-phosphate synthase